jgi:hypothetical protein
LTCLHCHHRLSFLPSCTCTLHSTTMTLDAIFLYVVGFLCWIEISLQVHHLSWKAQYWKILSDYTVKEPIDTGDSATLACLLCWNMITERSMTWRSIIRIIHKIPFELQRLVCVERLYYLNHM